MESDRSPCTGSPHPNTDSSSSKWSILVDDDDALNISQTLSLSLHEQVYNSLVGVFLGLLSLLTVIMNLLVLYAVKTEKSLHNVGNLYIVSLSVADLIVGTTVMPLNLAYLLEDEWEMGRAVCQFWLIMDYVASTASIFSLFILCLDRYRSVRHPLKYLKYRTRGRASAMIYGAWLLSMMWIIPILGWRSFANVELKPEEENKCDTDFRFVTWFKVITAIFNFYVPSILMLWFYWHIFLAVRQHLKDRERIILPTDSFGENEDGQNVGTPVKTSQPPKRECEVPPILSKKQHLFDKNTLDQVSSLEETDQTQTKASLRSHRKLGAKCQQASFLAMTTKQLRLVQKVKSCSMYLEKPQDTKCFEGDNENKLKASLNECHITVLHSVCRICKISKISDMQRDTGLLNSYDAGQALPWTEKEVKNGKLGQANAVTPRQTWQKFLGQSRQRIQSLKIHKEHKAAKQLGFIIAAFFLCWIPYFIVFMVMAFCRECVHQNLHMFTIWLGYINSTLNPFIYPLCNGNFKRVFKRYLSILLSQTMPRSRKSHFSLSPAAINREEGNNYCIP